MLPPPPPSIHQYCPLHVGYEFGTVESFKQLCYDVIIEEDFEFKPRSSKLHTLLFPKAKAMHSDYMHPQSIALIVFVSKHSIPSTVASTSIMAEINKQL